MQLTFPHMIAKYQVYLSQIIPTCDTDSWPFTIALDQFVSDAYQLAHMLQFAVTLPDNLFTAVIWHIAAGYIMQDLTV